MTKLPCWALLPAFLLLGCAHPGTRVEHDTNFDFSHYQRIGVTAFSDRRGEGQHIADGLDSGLRRIGHGGADNKVVAELLKRSKPDPDFGLGIETLEALRARASADAILTGSMAPDWSAASVTLIDTDTGERVLRALVKPAAKKRKAFADSDEVVRETLKVFDSLGQ